MRLMCRTSKDCERGKYKERRCSQNHWPQSEGGFNRGEPGERRHTIGTDGKVYTSVGGRRSNLFLGMRLFQAG